MDKNCKDIVPLTFPKIPPAEGIGLYLLSKIYEKEPKRYPNWDVARESTTLDLIQAKRIERLATKRLHDKRELRIKKNEFFNQQYHNLEVQETLFQTSFKRFNKFVKENQEKRERADKKVFEERALQGKRDNDIFKIKENITNLTDIKAKMDQKIKEYRMFEDYLQGVVRASPMFKNVSDIIVRYEALTEAKSFLGERQNKELASLESARAEMAKLLEEKDLVLIGLNNQLSELQGRYEYAKCNSLLWETLVSKIQDIAIQKTGELQSVKTACLNTYKNMCIRKGIEPKCKEEDMEGQLLLIKNTLNELKRIQATAKKNYALEANSSKGEAGSRKYKSKTRSLIQSRSRLLKSNSSNKI